MEALAARTDMSPDEAAFLADIEAAKFQAGVDRGRWHLISIDWPTAVIAISAAPRTGAPGEFCFRFMLDGYPEGATACPIDPENGQTLAANQRPKGELVSFAFRFDWENGEALYVPWDRRAIVGHQEWKLRYPSKLWIPEEGIVSYLRRTHDLLNSEDYEGV